MPKIFRRSSFAVILILLTFSAFTLITSANHSWNGYHWARQSNPFNLKLGDNVNSTWDPYLATTSSDWTVSTVLNTTIVAGGTTPKNCRPTNGRVEVCNSRYGNTGWLGVAQVWVSGSHITQGTVKLNDYYFDQAKYNTPAWRNLVTCQEVGHTLGLDHQDVNFTNPNLGTCMDYTNDPSTNQHPNQHDYDELVTIYSHLDSSTTVGLTQEHLTVEGEAPPAMNDIDFKGPGQWGKIIDQSPDGRNMLYELDFGNGFKVFTFVTWADPEDVKPKGENGRQRQN
ncbi:MAG: hypothetical protein HY231_00065 [Acidobacteria bacterium]|nr:hypothetical protein [Acidobacteriota bacterium]